ncbi:MAG: glycoside hydrolase family 127 protein [Lentisphaeria bacterium]|nr:glycoside hydrolase family 127 protein [Lentisphaeria bacterium]
MKNTSQIPVHAAVLPPGTVKLTGKTGELTDRVICRRINSEYARNTVYRETIEAFRNKIDDASGVIGIWQGEYWGKWVISAVRAAEYTGNAELKSFIRSTAYELISLQDADGCISTYKDPLFFNAAPPEEVKKVLGVESDWNWNIWCRKYTLWGLLESYRLLQEKPILDSASKLADNLIGSLEKKQIDLRHTGTFCGLASCSILKPVLQLYQYSGESRFMDFARQIVDSWRKEDGTVPNLITNAFSGKPLHQWYPEKGFWTKAYEMMSCVDGLLLYSEITGDTTILQAAENLYGLIREHESNCVGSVGFNDQFQNARIYLNSISEPCDAIHWMRMCFELFRLTGKVRYMDTFEETFLNAFLAGITRDGSWGMRAIRSYGHHLTAPEQAKMHFNHCCVNNMPRGLMNAAGAAVMLSPHNGLIFNFYLPLECAATLPDGNRIKVDISGDYQADGKARVRIDNRQNLTVRLRIPSWSKNICAGINGEKRSFSGDYAVVELPAGENIIDLTFDLNIRLEAFPSPDQELPLWHRRRYFEGKSEGLQLLDGNFSRLFCGPLILARSKLIGSTAISTRIAGEKCTVSLERNDSPENFALFTARFTMPDGSAKEEKVCDFASAGNIDSADPELFSVFF